MKIRVEILYLLIPLAMVLTAVAVAVLLWAVKSGQFDDLEGPAHRILWDDDEAATLREIRQHSNARPRRLTWWVNSKKPK